MALEIRDDPARHRYELFVDDHLVGFTEYHERGDGVYVLPHTVITERRRGAGHGAAPVQAALDETRRRGWKIVPQCPFVSHFIVQHPEYADLVA